MSTQLKFKEIRLRNFMSFGNQETVIDLSDFGSTLIVGENIDANSNNGAGKTTTIAKLAAKLKKEGQSVILGAGDTFRAAAIEQLTSWANKLDIPIIKTKQGHDSSAVAYDTICSAIARNIDNVIIDTAGRLQTQSNLNNELKKIVKVCEKALENRPYQKHQFLGKTRPRELGC